MFPENGYFRTSELQTSIFGYFLHTILSLRKVLNLERDCLDIVTRQLKSENTKIVSLDAVNVSCSSKKEKSEGNMCPLLVILPCVHSLP